MLIEKDCVVGIHVRMFDLQKNLLEETEPQGVTYLHGHGDIFPKLEQALEGKKAGETVVVQLEPDEAFGDFDDEAIRLVPVESLGRPGTDRSRSGVFQRPGRNARRQKLASDGRCRRHGRA